MKKIGLIFLLFLTISCKKTIEVTSIEQVPGLWKWEFTCGGAVYECTYGSPSHYATIDFKPDGNYIEKHNDTLFLQTNYSIVNLDNLMGTLVLENPPEERPLTILNNRLLITRGNLTDSYIKMK